MLKNDQLFKLIKSLGQAEKRYFKVFAKRHVINEENHYIKLFEAMEKMKEYDEEWLKKKLEEQTFSKNLPFWKSYLYGLIMKSLRAYHSGKTAFIQLQEYELDMQILIEKGLIKQALKIIRTAKKIAKKYHYDIKLLEFSIQERKLVRRFEKKQAVKLVESAQLESEQCLNRISDQFFWLKRYENIYLEGRYQKSQNTNQSSLPIALEQLSTTSDIAKLPFEASVYYHLMGAQVFTKSGDFGRSTKHLKSLIDHFEAHKWMIDEDQERYINIVNNYLNKCFLVNKLEEFPVMLDQMRQIKAKNFKLKSLIFQNVYYLQLIYHLSMKQYEEILDIVPYIKKGIETYKEYITNSRQLAMRYNIAVAYFLSHHYQLALDWINYVLDESREERTDFQSYSRLLQVILHFELKNWNLVEYLIKSYLRYLRKKNLGDGGEHLIIVTIRKIINSEERQHKGLFQKLQKELVNKKRRAGELEEVTTWLEEKV